MGPRRIAVSILLVALCALFGWRLLTIRRTVPTARTSEDLPVVGGTLEVETSPAPESHSSRRASREPALTDQGTSPPAAVSSRSEDIRKAIREVVGDASLEAQLHELIAQPGPTFPFEHLRSAIDVLGASVGELRSAFESSDPADSARASLLIGMGWDHDLDPGTRNWLASLGADIPSTWNSASDGSRGCHAVAATYALRFSGSEEHLIQVCDRVLPYQSQHPEAALDDFPRNVARIAIDGLQQAAGPEELARMLRIARMRVSEGLPTAAWRALVRLGGEGQVQSCLDAVRSVEGAAKAGLGSIRSPKALTELKSFLEESMGPGQRSYQHHVAPCAAEGILSIGTQEAFEYIADRLPRERTLETTFQRRAILEGLHRCQEPAILGDLLILNSGLGEDPEASEAIDAAIQRASDRAAVEHLLAEDVARMRSSLRRCIEAVPPESSAFERAFRLLGRHGDPEDRALLESLARSHPNRDALLEGLGKRR